VGRRFDGPELAGFRVLAKPSRSSSQTAWYAANTKGLGGANVAKSRQAMRINSVSESTSHSELWLPKLTAPIR